ncbi:MAG: methyltransferase domain-containing protein [Pseudomonadota bacterium]
MTEHGLDGAYSLEKPEDSIAYYKDWASSYDAEFAASHGYIVPKEVARAFLASDGAGPVLDIGAGTGLVGAALAGTCPEALEVDAIDISAEMLAVAESKGVYRGHICADLTKPLEIRANSYAGFVSAGTFTHGHVGPVCLSELLRIARPSALFVLAVNGQVFDQAGFGSAFAQLVAQGAIEPMMFRHVRYYAEDAEHAHADDMGLLAIFRKAQAAPR